MYIQVRTIDCKRTETLNVSKKSTVNALKVLVEKSFGIKRDKQRLFFSGKQLEGSYQLCDFNINLNDVVQVMEKQVVDPSSSGTLNMDSAEETSKSEDKIEWIPAESKYYTVGDLVDVKETDRGSWVEASILNIYKDPQYLLEETPNNDGRIYCVRRLIVDEIVDCFVSLGEIRPRARIVLQFEDLHVGDIVMVNYNEEDPKARGHWYDLTVQHLDTVKRKKVVSGTLHFTRESYLNNITITFSDEIMRIEENKLREEMTEEEKELMHTHIDFRPRAPICSKCCDHPRRRCRACSCYLCGGKDDPEKQILCDECDQAYHLGCLDPPLVNLPEMDEWYCPECKNDENEIVRAGGKLKESKRKSMAASKTTSSKRDWGKGMACVGRTKVCTIVPPDHFGPVPGVEVGTSWMFRMQASEAGIHRPHVAGIHGREDRGAFSIVLSGGYEDDVDNGDEFWYTGSGGRDLSGNKRTAAQSSDQKLTRMNRALALNCNAPINEQKGSESKDWKKGKPVRVIRSSKLAKHSTYAPSKGNRYDGIYKVVKYYPEKGKAGFIVWRYVLRRDDPTFAPWTKEGKERINRLGLKLQYPENYLEAMASKEKTEGKKTPKAIESHKRKRLSSRNSEENIEVHEVKKVRPEPHSLEKDLAKLIDQDINTKLWGECKKHLIEGTQKFLENVMEQFLCICCQDLVFEPVTTECLHTFCKRCLHRSFAAQVYTCPCCRTELGKDYEMEINEPLSQILVNMFPGYTAGRN